MTDKSSFITALRYVGKLLPGNYLKTFFYLNIIDKPRRLLRLSLNSFYRMDHLYAVIREFSKEYKGKLAT